MKMARIKLIETESAHVQEGKQITSLEFSLPIHALIIAINRKSLEMLPRGVVYNQRVIPLEAIAVNPDGRILEGRPLPKIKGCLSPIIYDGIFQGEEYKLSFFPITRAYIQTRIGVIHRPVIEEMVSIMREAYRLQSKS